MDEGCYYDVVDYLVVEMEEIVFLVLEFVVVIELGLFYVYWVCAREFYLLWMWVFVEVMFDVEKLLILFFGEFLIVYFDLDIWRCFIDCWKKYVLVDFLNLNE